VYISFLSIFIAFLSLSLNFLNFGFNFDIETFSHLPVSTFPVYNFFIIGLIHWNIKLYIGILQIILYKELAKCQNCSCRLVSPTPV